MLKSGAQFCKVQKSYYTDNHDAVEIKKYRNEFYIPAMEYHSRRAAVWTKVPVSEASAESLLDLCCTFDVLHISDLPVCCLSVVNGVEHITRNRQILHNKHLRRLSWDAFWRKQPRIGL